MTDRVPVKAVFTGADVTGLGEFEPGDTVPITNGGTGATTGSGALSNLGANIWETITADAGSSVASGPTDTFNVVGGTNISTSISGKTLTIDFTGTAGINIEDEGVGIGGGPHDTLNFVGVGVTAADAGAGTATITVPVQDLWDTISADTGSTTADNPTDTFTVAGGTDISTSIVGDTLTIDFTGFKTTEIFADQLLFPVTGDWAVGTPAAFTTDPNDTQTALRAFDDTTEEGVGFDLWVPAGATNITFTFVSRALTTPAGTRTIGLNFYVWEMPDDVATPGWNVGNQLDDVDVTSTGAAYSYDSQTHALGDIGLTADTHYIVELTRINPTAGTELSGDWALRAIRIEFS